MSSGAPSSFGAQLKALRETAGYTQEELATIAGLSVHAVSALERGERRRPHVETVRALSAALDLTGAVRDAFVGAARAPSHAAADELGGVSLPVALTTLLGREADLQTLQRWLADPTVRLVTLTGPGGVGKTRLALEIAHAIAAERATRVVFVRLAAIRDPALVASAIAEALGLADKTAVDLPKRLRVAFRDHPTLLVLDNFEQVLEAAPLAVDLLSSIASLRLLVTSRAALHLRGEREYALGPLPLEGEVDAMSPAEVASSPAVRLFIERAREAQPHFRLTPANTPSVAAICRRLDGLPLALELAAPWIKVLTPEDVLRRLADDVVHSSAVRRDLPERQQTMNATVAWSYQLLDPHEQHAFRRFGVMPGPFSIDAAAAVLAGGDGTPVEGEGLRVVAGLIDKSLLMRSAPSMVAGRPLYRMLETVRHAALERVAPSERDDAMEGLVAHCVAEASIAASRLVGPSQVEWLNRVREDLDSYRGILTWLIERRRPAEAVSIASGLMFFWTIRGHSAEGLRWYEQVLGLGSLSPEAKSSALLGASLMSYSQGDLERARTWLTRARALADGGGTKAIVTQSDYLLGRIAYASGDTHAARTWFTRSRDGFHALDIPWGIGLALNGMAWVALATGDVSGAARLLDEATSAIRHAGPWFLSATQNLRAFVAVRRRDPDQAIAWVRESLMHIRELQDTFAFAFALVPLAAAAVLKDDAAWAARILGARDAVTERTGAVIVDKPVQDLREHATREARARLGPDRWALAYAAGRKSSIDVLLSDINGVLPNMHVPIESRQDDSCTDSNVWCRS